MADTPNPSGQASGTTDSRDGPGPVESLEALRRAQRVLESTHQAVWWEGSPRNGQAWCSRPLLHRLGREPAGGCDWKHLVSSLHPDDRAAFEAACEAALAGSQPFSLEIRLQDGAGGFRWVRAEGRAWSNQVNGDDILTGTMTDIDAEKRAVMELEEVKARFDRVTRLAAMAYFERTEGDTHFYSNDSLDVLLGYPEGHQATAEEYMQRHHPDHLPRIMAERARCWAAPGNWDFESQLRHLDGSYRWIRGRGRSVRLPDGRMRLTAVLSDTHELRVACEELQRHREHLAELVDERTVRLEAALAESRRHREEAERANEAKSTFLAHMSHEIRTPLNGVLGLNELALRDAQTERQRRFLTLALSSGRSLLAVINDVLDFSRLNAEVAAMPKSEPFDLGQALADTLRGVVPLMRDKGIVIRYDYLGSVTRVLGDPQRLQQIAINLIGNAAKFTERGHLDVVADVRPEGPGRVLALITFRDTGPGMTPEIAARVFEPFAQGDERLVRRHGGTGLGLSIARGLSRSLGGELSLESVSGEGSTFMLRLPLAVAPGEQPLAERPPPGDAWLACAEEGRALWLQRRLLRMDWSSRIVEGLTRLLRELGPADAPAGVRPAAPQMVVLEESVLVDARALAQLRARLPGTRIVLLVRSDWSHPEVEAAARAADMPLLTIPLSPIELLDLLCARSTTPARADADSSDTLPIPPGLDVLVAEDNAVNQLIVSEMVRALGLQARLADDGAHAIEACLKEPPAVLLMDLQMPGLDGLEATRQLRELQGAGTLPPFPIVALTAHATPQDQARAVEAGMVGYLTKPFGLLALRAELARCLHL